MALRSMKKDLQEIRDRLRGIVRKEEVEAPMTFAATESLMEHQKEDISQNNKIIENGSSKDLAGSSNEKVPNKKSKKKKLISVIIFIAFLSVIFVDLYLYFSGKAARERNAEQQALIEKEEQAQSIEEGVSAEGDVPESEYVIDGSSIIKSRKENDAIRLSKLSDFANSLIQYSVENKIAFPVSENYAKLNEENNISSLMKKIGTRYKKGEDFLKDPSDPDFYFAYRSLDGETFEFTAQMEIAEDYDCEEEDMKKNNICVYRFVMDEITIDSVRNILK